MNPYQEIQQGEITIRTFKKDVQNDELVWHRDHEDRYVKIVEGKGWELQIDNELPVELEIGKEYFIPKKTFHRIIKGSGNLIVNIKEVK